MDGIQGPIWMLTEDILDRVLAEAPFATGILMFCRFRFKLKTEAQLWTAALVISCLFATTTIYMMGYFSWSIGTAWVVGKAGAALMMMLMAGDRLVGSTAGAIQKRRNGGE